MRHEPAPFLRYLPFRDLAGYRASDLRHDLFAAVAVTALTVPQAVAYALIAGLPPAMGLYAAAVPVVVGALLRSSRHVVTGPTNAVSLLVGTVVAASTGTDPVTTAVTLALVVGILQILAGILSLGALVDFISSAVVRGYITGAGVLIALAQLPHVTATAAEGGLVGWAGTLGAANPASVLLAGGTVALVLGLRRIAPRIPGAVAAMGGGILFSLLFDVRGLGLVLLGDLGTVPLGLPPLTVPAFGELWGLVAGGTAVMVLSLVESSAIARTLAGRTRQRIDVSAEFTGQGFANVAAAFFGAFPTSGSLARSAANEETGARSRLSGVFAGLLLLGVLLFLGPVVDLTPVACLAGLLLVIGVDLVEVPAIRALLRSRGSDKAAFLATLGGTFVLRLDEAIFLGVAISLVMFLRRARLLVVRELGVDRSMHLREIASDKAPASELRFCRAIKILHLEGSLFYGAATELSEILDAASEDLAVRVLIVRIKRTRDLDYTTASVLQATQARLQEQGRRMFLVGLRDRPMRLMQRTGIAEEIGREYLYPTQPGWFEAMHDALEQALGAVGPHECDGACPLEEYLERRLQSAVMRRPEVDE